MPASPRWRPTSSVCPGSSACCTSRATICRAFTPPPASSPSNQVRSGTHACAPRSRILPIEGAARTRWPRACPQRRRDSGRGDGREVPGQFREQRTGHYPERGAAVLAADAVDGERAEIVEREGLPWQQPHHQALDAREYVRQPHDVARQPCNARGETHELLECEHFGSAQLIGRADTPWQGECAG